VHKLLKKISKYERYRVYSKLMSGRSYKNTYRIPWPKYIQILKKSWMSISCRGAGFDTHRFYEIPYVWTVLVSEYPKILIPNNYELRKIAKLGREHVLKYHTPDARAKYILAHLKHIH